MDAPSPLPRVCGHEICSARGAAGAPYSLSACAGDVRRHGVFAVHDHGERLAVVGLLEGRLTAHQHVEDDAQAPDVCRGRRQRRTQHSSEFGKQKAETQGGRRKFWANVSFLLGDLYFMRRRRETRAASPSTGAPIAFDHSQ